MLLLLLALGVAAVALAGQQPTTTPPPGPGPGSGPGLPPTTPPPVCPQLDKLPLDLRKAVEELVKAGNGPGLVQAAIVARSYGLDELATCLELEAAQAGGGGGPVVEPPIVGPGLPEVDLLSLCPSASALPPDLLAQLETMIETSGQGESLRQIANTLAFTMPELADCLEGLANLKDQGEL